MKLLTLKPEMHLYDTCKEFHAEIGFRDTDLIITNRYIFEPYFSGLPCKARIIWSEDYGSGEPSDEMVEKMLPDTQGPFRRVIAIGGGAIIDIAKLFALRRVSPVQDLFDRKLEIVRNKELIVAPTTCGTGSEVTNISILEMKSRRTKLGLAADELYADRAALVPELLSGLPFKFFATSSVDALIHAFEASLSPKATPYTSLFGHKAIEIILKGYRDIANKGEKARLPLLRDFLIASNYAGVAFGSAGCAAVHAMSYPLSAAYHVPHGEANYAIFMGVFKTYQRKNPHGGIRAFNAFLAGILECAPDTVYEELEKLLAAVIPLKALREYQLTRRDLSDFTRSVMERQGRLMANNYTELDEKTVLGIYESLY
ncbi:MAG: 4-hydroxybutyrate dehydrogenase [Deltaproteobacteria bacterium]|jgi:4-hydroxybutyrate dehydrogenase|nr:4-hydroxybutyrate dehydrogenase [Deltaproteobacteria bacterium]